MLENGFIKLHRSFLKWEWYDDPNTMRLFVHLLLTVSIKTSKWHGETIKRGERVASYSTLNQELNISIRSIRTALEHLKSTGEVTVTRKPKFSIITVNNYEKFQQVTGNATENQQSSDNQVASNRQQYKKVKEDNKNVKEDIDVDVFAEYANGDNELLKALNEFDEMRKSIKKPLTSERAKKILLSKLDELATENSAKIKLLEQATFNNWLSVYPLNVNYERFGKLKNERKPTYDIEEFEKYMSLMPPI